MMMQSQQDLKSNNMENKRIFITGGAGYVGSRLVPQLIEEGYLVTVYDIMYFGFEFLPKTKNLNIIKGDIRDREKIENCCKNHDVFINLACISNDTSFELDEKLSTSINLTAFEPMVLAAKKSKIKRFIHASTSSVYGISKEKDVKEDHPLVPLTLYNKYKAMCEPLLLKQVSKDFEAVIFRPATVCGFAERQRFDLSVNILTNHAINNKKITVFGGDQLRPNLHIQDYCDLVKLLINADSEKVSSQIFNVGYQNMSINEIANVVKNTIQKEFPEFGEIPIVRTESNDNRSYHINSDKIKKVLGYQATRSVEDAVKELCDKFKEKFFSDTLDNEFYFNIKRMKNLKAS